MDECAKSKEGLKESISELDAAIAAEGVARVVGRRVTLGKRYGTSERKQ